VAERVLRLLHDAWNELRASCAGLTDGEMLAPGVAGRWSVRDVLAHVTVWEEEALKHLPVVLAGGRPPRYADAYGGIDAFNALTSASRSGLTLAEVRRQHVRVHRRLLDYVATIPDGALGSKTRARRRLRLDTYGHYRHHAAAIRKWRGQVSFFRISDVFGKGPFETGGSAARLPA
jgi:hypothetical protein